MSRVVATVGAIAAAAAAALTGCAADEPSCDLGLDLDAEACAVAAGLTGQAPLGPAPGNAVGDDPAAARLGFRVFYDARFSANSNVRCATCHEPHEDFTDHRALAVGLATGDRNAPTVAGAVRQRWLLWDGRADSVWSQPLMALENPAEMGFSRLEIAHRLAQSYRDQYEAIFGPLPALDDAARFPAAGKPGDPAWEAMAAADRDAIDEVAANLGKALEAYERKLEPGAMPLDRFLAGDLTALDDAARRGLEHFVDRGCATCHGGPELSDGGFHAVGTAGADPARAGAAAVLDASPFTAAGRFWDGEIPADFPLTPTAADQGAYRTPRLRGVAITGPWGHDGRWATLRDAVVDHARGGGELAPIELADDEIDELAAFLATLSGAPPPLPWGDWPSR